MWIWILWVVAALLVMALGTFLALVVSMRTKNRRGLLIVRRFGRRIRPRALRDAGEPGAYAAVIRHVGRKSGAPYATPIGVYPMDGDFLVYLPYGTEVDWLRNVRAAGSAELRFEGHTHVVAPEMVEPAEALPHLSAADRRVARLFGVTDFLALRRVPVVADGAS